MKRPELEDRVRRIVFLYTDAGPRAGVAITQILALVDECVAERGVPGPAPASFGVIPAEEIQTLLNSIRGDLRAVVPQRRTA